MVLLIGACAGYNYLNPPNNSSQVDPFGVAAANPKGTL